MGSRYKWSHRRTHREDFPIECDTCASMEEIRFKTNEDLEKHNAMTTRHSPDYIDRDCTKFERFLNEHVIPDAMYRELCKRTVKKIENILMNDVAPKYRPSEVIRAGSTEKDTAIKGSFDVDIVCLLGEQFTSVEQLYTERKGILKNITRALCKANYKVDRKSSNAIYVRVDCNEHEAGEHHKIDVNVLPAVNLQQYSRDEIYTQLESSDIEVRKFFTPSLTHWQQDFIKQDRPEKLKRIIRLIKYWKHNTLKRPPSSYVMELLVMHLWQQSGSPENFEFFSALGLVMQELSFISTIQVEFNEFYDEVMQQSHRIPYIIDPVNPFLNIMDDYKKWVKVANIAREFLKRKLFRNKTFGFAAD